MEEKDKETVLDMMKVFYHSPAVLVKASDEILQKDIEDCISDLPFIEGFVMEEDHVLIGYSMAAKSYSTEYGGVCIWIEDIYFIPEYRGKGLLKELFSFLETTYKDLAVRFRLEAEKNNESALKSYFKNGYHQLEYMELSKEV